MDNKKINFTGEFFVPGATDERIAKDHMERYKFAANYSSGKSVLDIACGVGYSSEIFIQNQALSYDGVDINDELVEFASLNYKSNNVNYHLGDICKFDIKKQFDLITCFETIEHVEDYKGAIKNLYKLLNPGGKLLISSPNRIITSPNCNSLLDKPKNKYHCQEFIPKELIQSLIDNDFIINKQEDCLFGQRQRHVVNNKFTKKLLKLFYGNPDNNTSPKVTLVTNKSPRYFILVASK